MTVRRKSSGVTSTSNRVARGEALLREWHESRQPFILYLRSYRVIMYHGPDNRMLLENHLWATLQLRSIGVLTIVDPNEVPLPGAYGHGAPALSVADDKWQTTVSDLIKMAEMIVFEVPVLSRGAAFELKVCAESGNLGQAVVIIPPSPVLTTLRG